MFDLDMSNVKPSILNAFVILAIVMVMVPLAKWALSEVYIPGLSELSAAI